MNSSQAVVVLCTAPDEASARSLAHSALSARLAACVTLLPGATSLYVWEGKLQETPEVQLVLKSDNHHQQALLALLKAQHPYDTPELLVLPVTHGESDYLSWLTVSLR
ncbi:divalent-cation tolerance protein CutA [Erwinia sp. OLTSP20]|uniref:divalent cation tolerance protein CutA n=1 Tax=unclassified Erwinia TaxID=2622719 RepID=UPI000C19A5E6|nr:MULTISPECIES: divalent cation tolerance protein CutA [unclassified Erwinia]PIJ52095.1 divalent-cation tolerance protein CutA [Erwinia sp. OAMSP11]PIJ75257.1 divalent-cation tolerance protein CutA [Erwinia sp. OLSSP12]PIJ84464.1 divalent-cation tolerance protein CutA [Erwinia sp. OLCASP19]PIJ87078.1 divalent-cation tolerance protein CutA [Erwinia sp. OLMTSP26]PIJ88642.1 divalent-cation tolerance protein CutA [Erwinia sp. OLMDSP33]